MLGNAVVWHALLRSCHMPDTCNCCAGAATPKAGSKDGVFGFGDDGQAWSSPAAGACITPSSLLAVSLLALSVSLA